MTIQLQPNGDIIIDGVKVGEWENTIGITKKYRLKRRGIWRYDSIEQIIKNIQYLLTNGFTPQKWEE